MKAKQLLTNWRIILLVLFLIFAFLTIKPNPWNDGITIRSVDKNSAAFEAGMHSPLPIDKPMQREVITQINGINIKNVEDFELAVSDLKINDTLLIKTKSNYEYLGDKRQYHLFSKSLEYHVLIDEQSATKVEERYNETLNAFVNETIVTHLDIPQKLGLNVYNSPKTNIKKGLDLEGGTRVLLKPEEEVSIQDLDIIISNLKQRLNVYGLSDIVVRSASDFLEGYQYISVEIAGVGKEEVENIVSRQGKFEAKIGEKTIFRGGEDIKNVCRTPDCSFPVDPSVGCRGDKTQGYSCTFSFSITLSKESAERQADATRNLQIIEGSYLSENLDFYLDDELVDSLRIHSNLRGQAQTQISISGPGVGRSLQEAQVSSAQNMKELQTVLITGSLPVKLEMVKADTISPALGQEFLTNAILVGLVSIFVVAAIIYVRYRSLKISIPIIITMISEVILILWFAALVGWNIDLAAIAGIIVAVGTGVDDQIVITDEALNGENKALNWKKRIKNAFFIIMASYFTTLVAMAPLWSAGAGLLRGFAITTIIGISIGVLVTRPAFAAIIENIIERE